MVANCVDNRTKHYLLDAMGITQWLPKHSGLLMSDKPHYCAACLVILPERPSDDKEQQKILNGMLSVLELPQNELCIAWLSASMESSSQALLIKTLNEWAPYTILLMGSLVTKKILSPSLQFDEHRLKFQRLEELDATIQVTYHPTELQDLKDNKKKAYRDLLVLKDQLSIVRKTW